MIYPVSFKYVRRDDAVVDAFIQTITTLQEARRKIIFVSPPPRSGKNIGGCLDRECYELITFSGGCDFQKSLYHRLKISNLRLLKRLQVETGVDVIWLEDLMCDDGVCKTKRNKTYLYSDGGHLTISGSREVLDDMSWLDYTSRLN